MALKYGELESITDDYFAADGGKAQDIYYNESYAVNHFLKQKKGMWMQPPGGNNIRVPLMYDGAEGGFYSRGESLSSNDRENINSAYFGWKHVYGNATIYRTDELSNTGSYAEVSLLETKLMAAQKRPAKDTAQQLYSAALDTAKEFTGLRSCCSSATTTAYGGIQEADLVANDGSYPWKGVITAGSSTPISLAVIRTLRTNAKISDGPGGKPNIGFTTEALYNTINGLLQVQQRFEQDTETVKAGFQNLIFEGMKIVPDDYCTSGYFFAINDKYFGFAAHPQGYFTRSPWESLLSAGPAARSMKIFLDGNFICSNRKAQAAYSGLV